MQEALLSKIKYLARENDIMNSKFMKVVNMLISTLRSLLVRNLCLFKSTSKENERLNELISKYDKELTKSKSDFLREMEDRINTHFNTSLLSQYVIKAKEDYNEEQSMVFNAVFHAESEISKQKSIIFNHRMNEYQTLGALEDEIRRKTEVID